MTNRLKTIGIYYYTRDSFRVHKSEIHYGEIINNRRLSVTSPRHVYKSVIAELINYAG